MDQVLKNPYLPLKINFLGEDTCSGDGGDPLVSRSSNTEPWFQVGVQSFGPRTCGNGVPSIYTKVAAHLAWIEKNLEP